MMIASAHAAHHDRGWAPASRTGGGFTNYLMLLREAFSEALDRTSEARRKYPFADV